MRRDTSPIDEFNRIIATITDKNTMDTLSEYELHELALILDVATSEIKNTDTQKMELLTNGAKKQIVKLSNAHKANEQKAYTKLAMLEAFQKSSCGKK